MIEIALTISLISLIAVGFAAMRFWAQRDIEQKWREAVEESSAKMLVEQKRIMRRYLRDRNKWELAAARFMGARIGPTPTPSNRPMARTSRFVSPSEAIHRTQQEVAGTPTISTDPVPPAVKSKFLQEASSNGK